MRPGARVTVAVALAVVGLGAARDLCAQIDAAGEGSNRIGTRVGAAGDGTVRLSYEVKPGVEICDRGIRMGDRHMTWRSGDFDRARCITDVVEVDVSVRDGVVRDVDVVRPLDERPDDLVEDLGEMPPREAVDFLMGLAYAGATAKGAEEAVFPATLADVDDVWRDLIGVARDRAVHERVRKNALFWLGQEAADAATDGLSEVALAEDEDQEVRDAAIFALSQRPDNQAIGALIEVARSAEQAESRRTAMFWLAQSEDERVVSFFEQVLLGRNR